MFNLDKYLTPDNLTRFIILFPIIVLSVAIHEFAHCWITDRLGDDTPRNQGRVTLNPLAHLDPLGTILMAVSCLIGFGIGWGKASPYNPFNFRNPARDRMLSTIAGPISNILQMLAWASLGLLFQQLMVAHILPPIRYFDETPILLLICVYGVGLNAVLAAFNLLPVYPLDGHHVLSYIAPPSWRPIIDNPLWGLIFLYLIFSGAARFFFEPIARAAIIMSRILVGWP